MRLKSWTAILRRGLWALMCAPLLGACSNMKHVEWTEDVRLSDGRMIVVQRSEDYIHVVDAGAGFQSGWLLQTSSISADLPAPVSRKLAWDGSLRLLVLDIQPDGIAYLVGGPANGRAADEWKLPRHEWYVVLRLETGGLERIPVAELPLAVQPNLLGSTHTLFIHRNTRSGTHVDLKLKSELDASSDLGERYKTIVRLPAPAKRQ